MPMTAVDVPITVDAPVDVRATAERSGVVCDDGVTIAAQASGDQAGVPVAPKLLLVLPLQDFSSACCTFEIGVV